MKKQYQRFSILFLIIMFAFISTTAFATNGMNMEGYGPIAVGMGGASMAYDNGVAAVMNNPATLGLMPEGDRFDLALGYLGPHVTSKMSGMPDSESSADAFYMPALGWAKKSGQFTFGAGLFSQGGMGTDYSADSFLAANSGEKVRSEVSFGRVLFPLTYEINKNLSIGGTVDFVWAGMDLKMALSGAQFMNMMPGQSQTYGQASGSMVTSFNNFIMAGYLQAPSATTTPVNWGRFDFSDDSDFTGKAKGYGAGAKIGAVYKVMDKLSVGAAYHSKTAISDLETSSSTVTFNVNMDDGFYSGGANTGTYTARTIPVKGKIKVKNFEWPQMFGAGAAYEGLVQDLILVFDYKWINWKNAMKNMEMSFTADSSQSGLATGFADTKLDATMYQKWKDQHVFMLGAGYKVTKEFTMRAGANFSNNPVPDKYMNPLFPAIIEKHYMLGAGYIFTKSVSADASFTYAPEVTSKNGQGVETSHSQTNAQLMLSYLF